MDVWYRNSELISDVPVMQSAEHEREMMKSDFVRLSWNDSTYRVLPVDAYIIYNGLHYSLLEPYIPTQKSECEWQYEPQFQHPKMYLSKVTFKRPSTDTSGNAITYLDWPYTGTISTLLGYLIDEINDVFGFTSDADKFKVQLLEQEDKVISINFSSNDILSAISNICNACECEAHLDWDNKMLWFGKVYLGTDANLTIGQNVGATSSRNSKEGYWNAFQPQGSTRNIFRKSSSEEFVQSDVRLSLRNYDTMHYPDGGKYPDGIIYITTENLQTPEEKAKGYKIITKSQLNERAFIKPLIFEEVYPKTNLYVYKVCYREQYRLDDNGEKVAVYTDDQGITHYLRYAVWYIKLAYKVGNDWIEYAINDIARFGYTQSAVRSSGNTVTIPLTAIDLKDEWFSGNPTQQGYAWEVLSEDFHEKGERVVRIYMSQHPGYTLVSYELSWADENPYDDKWWEEDPEPFTGNVTKQYNAEAKIIYDAPSPQPSGVETIDYVEDVVFKPIFTNVYTIVIQVGNVTRYASINIHDHTITVNNSTSADKDELLEALGNTEYLQVINGVNTQYVPKEYKVTTIIDGTQPIIAFQPNTEQNALTSPLAGLGNGDGNGHYGFKIKNLRTVDQTYIGDANRYDASKGETGILIYDPEHPEQETHTQIDSTWFEICFEENDTTIIPTTKEQGIIPKGFWGDLNSIANKIEKGNLVNVYNVVVDSQLEESAKTELERKTLEYISDHLKDTNAYTVKSYPASFKDSDPNLTIGRKVILDDGLDPTNPDRIGHILNTRVQKIVKKIDFSFEQEITVGNAIIKSTQTQVKEKVEGIISGNVATGSGVSETYIRNIAAQVVSQTVEGKYISRLVDDVAQGAIGFVKGIWIKAKELFGFDGEGNIKANNIDAAGDVVVGGLLTALRQVVNNAQSTNYVGGELAGTGWKLTNDNGEGNSRLEVDEVVARMRIVASVLEARQYCALGGNYVFSPAASIIDRVDYLNDDIHDSGSFVPDIYYGAGLYVTNTSFTIPAGATIYLSNEAGYDNIYLTDENLHDIVSSTSGTLSYTAEEYTVVKVKTVGQPTVTYKIYQEVIMGYEEVKVPWLLRKMPLWARNAVSARYKKVHILSPDFDPSTATKYRCWIKADDGTTKTINTWRVGMLARCQTLDVEVSPDGNHAQTYYEDEVDEVTAHKNKFYWREVYAVGTGRLPIDDGYDHHYVDLSNETNHFYTGSDIPSAGDSIVCFGDRLNQDTSHLIIIETVGADAPAIKEYKSVGYVDGTSINWSLTGKMRTCISPTSGNIFVAPRFIVEIAEDDHRDLATFIVDTDGMRSTVKSSAGNRNLFSFKACTFGVTTNDCGYPAVQSYGMLLRFAGDTDTTGRLARVLIPSLEQGKTYTLSCQIRMTGSVGAPEKTRIAIDLGDTHSGMKTIEVTTSWQTIEVPLLLNNTSNPEYKWIDFGIYGDDYVAGNYALLRHIKLEEGGMATAFTVANEDANYVTNVRPVDEWLLNANIAEDSTVTCPSGKKVYKTLAMPSVPSGQADEYIDYITANGLTTIEIGKVYTISYWVKSSANNTHRVKTFMYPDLTPVLQDFMALVGDDGQTERIATDCETEVGVTTEWKKHYIHVYVMSLPSGGVVNCIPLRLTRTTGSALNTTGTLYISDVQLCEGYVSDNNTTVNESYSEIKQTAYEITQRVQSVEDDVDGLTVDVAELEMTADSITSEVKQLHKGKNMLSGVLDGTGWRSANSSGTPQAITKNVVDNWIEHNNLHVYVISPDVSIKKDTKYTFSFDVGSYITTAVNVYVKNGSGAPTPISLVDEQGRAITQPMTTGISGRRSVTFVPVANATAMIYVEVDKIHFPQLETGNTATAFEAPSSDTISQIKQTANSIEAKVNNTGVDITNGLIRLEGGKVEIEESVEVPTVLSMNDYMYTQIQAGSVEIRSKNSASFGLFQINALNEIVLTMYDKDGNCVVNLGGSQNATTYGGWQEMKLKAVDPTVTIGGLSEFTNNGNGESTWRLMLGKLTNSASVLQYFTPSGNETVNSGVKGRDNCVFTSKTGTYPQTQQGTSDEETAINALTPISSGYYVFPNNGIFMQDMLGTYVVMIYRYNSDGRLVQTIKHEFTN